MRKNQKYLTNYTNHLSLHPIAYKSSLQTTDYAHNFQGLQTTSANLSEVDEVLFK